LRVTVDEAVMVGFVVAEEVALADGKGEDGISSRVGTETGEGVGATQAARTSTPAKSTSIDCCRYLSRIVRFKVGIRFYFTSSLDNGIIAWRDRFTQTAAVAGLKGRQEGVAWKDYFGYIKRNQT
jgi:hypothetical protein